MKVLIVKPSLLSPIPAHFAGGKWAVTCCGRSLNCVGAEVHILTCASRAQLLAIAVSGSVPGCNLASIQPSSFLSGVAVVQWQAERCAHPQQSPRQGSMDEGITSQHSVNYNVVLSDDCSQARVHQALVSLSALLGSKDPASTPPHSHSSPHAPHALLIVDADGSQFSPYKKPERAATPANTSDARASAASGAGDGTPQCSSVNPNVDGHLSDECSSDERSLFTCLVACWQHRCLALVQNVHFLPFGPSGTARRTSGMLKAWSQLGGIISVSEAVAGYLREWWPGSGLSMPPVRVVHLSAFGCFGRGPFQDFGLSALKQLAQCSIPARTTLAHKPLPIGQGAQTQLAGAETAAQPSSQTAQEQQSQTAQHAGRCCSEHRSAEPAGQAAQQQQSQTAQHAGSCRKQESAEPVPMPVLGVLKLTPEKGCSIVLALAQQLQGCFDFLIVAGDPKIAEVLSPQPNVTVIEPQGNIDEVLSRVCLVLAPSLWFESWGMVVTEAMLRGLPCIVSNAGGLPEAGLDVCPVCPVAPVEIPTDSEGTPIWALRQYPKQDMLPWVKAIQQATQPEVFSDLSRRCRQAGHSFLEQGAQEELPGLLSWLKSLSV